MTDSTQAPERGKKETGKTVTGTAETRPKAQADPLHGVKLEQLLKELVAEYDWPGLAARVPVNCFKSNPSIKSSLKFLRKTPWARQKVEALYLTMQGFSPDKRATKTDAVLEAEVKRQLADNRRDKPARDTVASPKADPWARARGNQ